jgi:hypothetical protein
MNKYIWAELRGEDGVPTIRNIIARGYKIALEKIAEVYEDELDVELPFDDWDDLADALINYDIIIGDKLIDIEEL